MQKIKECVVCGMEIEGNARILGNARKTCSIVCRDQRYNQKLIDWMKVNALKMKNYHREYQRKNPRNYKNKPTLSPWAPMHSYDVLSD